MKYRFDTQAIHTAYNPDEHNRAIMPPLYQNSMFVQHELGENIPHRYSRLSNPTRQILEDTVAELEHGAHGFAFSSGMAAPSYAPATPSSPFPTFTVAATIC